MKKSLIIFAILLMGTVSWAQSNSAEEAAIKKVIETESKAAGTRDYDLWINCFAKSPHVAFGFTTLIPSYMMRSYDKLADFAKGFFINNPISESLVYEITDYQIRINGTSAFATAIQTYTNKNGTKDRYHKADYLEKIDGEWKIIGHLFSQEPKPDTGGGN